MRLPLLRPSRCVVFGLLLAIAPTARAWAQPLAERLEGALTRVETLVDREGAEFATLPVDELRRTLREVERWAASLGTISPNSRFDDALARQRWVLDAKQRTDRCLDGLLERRKAFARLGADETRAAALTGYLQATEALVDLSGRLRYLLRDVIASVSVLAGDARSRSRLLDQLEAFQSEIGAVVMAPVIFEQYGVPRGGTRVDGVTKIRMLRLIASAGSEDLLDDVAALLELPNVPPELVLEAATTIRQIGLPQEPRPGSDASLPAPAITPGRLFALVDGIDPSRLGASDAARRGELRDWLEQRAREGVTEEGYRIGRFEVQPGDWLLMRNPSPYNRFTDLSPGLFTHVGVVAAETGSDGVRRIVLVDLPERGTSMPATNVEIFLQRTLHYVFLRYDDPAGAKTMGRVAASTIGNETQFDLNFRTDRVRELQGEPLEGKKIHTYCAGLLLLCAQETGAPRQTFFPIEERPAGGLMQANLATLGISIGDEFLSPTGALFSERLHLVGRREPMYEPTREIEEGVFDHFALSLVDKKLSPSQTLYQSLRVKLAQAAQVTPLLGRALARANDVSPEMDLVAAARAAAVVETLDEIAFGASEAFLDARDALRAGGVGELSRQGLSRQEIEQVQRLQRQHAELYRRWSAGQISPRELREQLVDYYRRAGIGQLDERFFQQ